ncbi:MAG: hypothetical protein COX92_00350 [Candidatus Nealsonbacteria bacterium CG_4_10_14_0_2_um_filter_40_15]|uniref:Homing endonuclease LAGLIDADG domain-containing protein n=2 Tax=Candidatus Nealsoniibacteriota TaxID=1817911 RepID=A0A2M7D7S4_9BACT|nr:MAG: hypothetical protein COS26_02025 [Candidatus Nealsonbacteria bacterium CG02_land_8_20_14_3_00_40_11]PIZ87794.1 MAG: hypothetical protein COX92_00350 [Candidatus Nealsonbacteria bacterium CG_4_10_14_0_2_um_filter_40_15]
MKYINLKMPEHSYFFGFAQTDGSLTKSSRNRGKLQIEIGEKDLHILRSFKKLFPLIYSSIRTRVRDTNFKKHYRSYVLAIFNMQFREEINESGIQYGKKSENNFPPNGHFCERDYIRGLLDGDGSIGMRLGKYPFVSFTVKSERLKDYLLNVIEKITKEKKKLDRNRRDNIYNIMLNREKAQKFINYLYYSGCLTLKRKFKKAKAILLWERPKSLKKIFRNEWHNWEDNYVLTHALEESCKYLKRTDKSVKMRLWHLKHKKNNANVL